MGVKLVISEAASSNKRETVLLLIDVRRAHFNAKATRRVHVEHPEEDGGGPGRRAHTAPVTLPRTGNANLEVSSRKFAYAEGN